MSSAQEEESGRSDTSIIVGSHKCKSRMHLPNMRNSPIPCFTISWYYQYFIQAWVSCGLALKRQVFGFVFRSVVPPVMHMYTYRLLWSSKSLTNSESTHSSQFSVLRIMRKNEKASVLVLLFLIQKDLH